MTRITSTVVHEDGSVTATTHDHPGKRLVMGDDPDRPFILVDDEQDTADFCPDCLITWDLHPFRTGTLRDCMRAIAQEAAGRKHITD